MAVVDDRQLLADALGITLGTDPAIDVVGVYTDLATATKFVHNVRPDVLVLDFSHLRSGQSAALIATLQSHSPNTKILVLIQHADQLTILTCIRIGADGYLTKQSSPSALIDAVKRIWAGDVLYPAAVMVNLLMDEPRRDVETNGSLRPQLVPRELDVLQAFADGLTTDEVAAQLGIGCNTIRAHLRGISAKLGARSRLEAVLIGLRTGLIKLAD